MRAVEGRRDVPAAGVGVPAVDVVDVPVAVVVDAVAGRLGRVGPEVEVGVVQVEPAVDDPDGDPVAGGARAAGEVVPRLGRVDVGVGRAAALAGVAEPPHLAEAAIAGHGGAERDLVVELRHLDARRAAHRVEHGLGGAVVVPGLGELDEPDVQRRDEQALGREALAGEPGRSRHGGNLGVGREADDELAGHAGLGALRFGGRRGGEEEKAGKGGAQATAKAENEGHGRLQVGEGKEDDAGTEPKTTTSSGRTQPRRRSLSQT